MSADNSKPKITEANIGKRITVVQYQGKSQSNHKYGDDDPTNNKSPIWIEIVTTPTIVPLEISLDSLVWFGLVQSHAYLLVFRV